MVLSCDTSRPLPQLLLILCCGCAIEICNRVEKSHGNCPKGGKNAISLPDQSQFGEGRPSFRVNASAETRFIALATFFVLNIDHPLVSLVVVYRLRLWIDSEPCDDLVPLYSSKQRQKRNCILHGETAGCNRRSERWLHGDFSCTSQLVPTF
jgi:hypothetical protein